MSNRRRNFMKEEGLADPLANVEQFNIIQFLSSENEFNLPLDEPLDPINGIMRQNGNVVPDPQHTNSNMYQKQAFQLQTSRLPESPPITDISGGSNGSSSSPSTNSDPPYSPENYNPYPVGHNQSLSANAGGNNNNNNNNNNSGMILGVHELQNTLLQQELHRQSGRNAHMQSPQTAACFMSPYPPSNDAAQQLSALTQVSPPPNIRNENFTISHTQYTGGQMDTLYNMLNVSNDGSLNSQNSEAPISRKRPRMDNQFDAKFAQALGQNASSPIDSNYPSEENCHQMNEKIIKFTRFQEELWNPLYDAAGRELKQLQVHVVADKGFCYLPNENCFVNQKKNHFQISVHVEASDSMPPKNIRYNGHLVPIKDFKLAFCGVKAEMPTSEICIRQSRTDRKPHPHNPVLFEIQERRMTKVTVPRLHFSETTFNNQRKNNRPNPDQKHFLLVVRLFATLPDDNTILIQSYASEKVIVRATNPAQFDSSESEVPWIRNNNTLFSRGPVSIGTDRSVAKLTVEGNIYASGTVNYASDIRLKEKITAKEAGEALENMCKMRVVDFFWKPEVAEKWGLSVEERKRTGLIAQELNAVLPDAVKDIGDYLTINESRVFYETVLALQELCRLTGDLDNKIDEKVEEISERLTRYARQKKLASSMASNLNGDTKSMMSYSRTSLDTLATEKRRKSARRSSKDEDSLCNSKCTQGTIIGLVVVMAFCLLSMTALYVMDWHNRNYGYHQLYPDLNLYKNGKDAPANIINSPEIPANQPNAPPLMSQCMAATCKMYCCSDQFVYNEDETGTFTEKLQEIGTTGTSMKRTVLARRATAKSNIPEMPLNTGVIITIPQLNLTIDRRYCVDKYCNRKRSVYNLYIPVSPFLPDLPLEVEFKVPRAMITNNCGYLSDFPHKVCPKSNYHHSTPYPISDEIMDNVFELSVGGFVQSAYRFRVSATTEACFANEEHLNGNFEEYNLFFYRTCSMNINGTIDATTV